jgi:S1-C subfamily serine protease
MEERRVIKTIKRVMPTVVSVVVSKHLADIEKNIPAELYAELPKIGTGKNRKVKIPEEFIDDDGMVEVGGGSGFIVEPAGIIVTNKHVVSEPGGEYTILLNDNRRMPAEILTRDPLNDVAILKIKADKLPCVELGDASRLELGQEVIAIGNALGMFRNTVSRGIVSGLSRSIQAHLEGNAASQEMRGLIQTDAAINVGNSGGPLVDIKGRAIGINSAIVSGAQSIGFAIPINAVKRDLRDLKKYGHIRRPLLGVRYMIIDGRMQTKLDLPVAYGALVLKESSHDHGVVPGSPAHHAGIMEQDIILELNGSRIDRDHPIQDFLEDLGVGDVVELTILRGGRKFASKVTLTERK